MGSLYCQTLEKRSSSPPKPLDPVDAEAVVVVVWPPMPVLLDQPPNSSSAATLGAGLKPPPAPGTMGVLAKALLELLPQPMSLLTAGLLMAAAGWTAEAGGGGLAAAGVAHSLPPQASMPDRPELLKPPVLLLVIGAGAATGLVTGLLCGAERLKTEFVDAGCCWAGGETGGGDDCDTGAEKSKRSAMAEDEEVCAGFEGAGGDAIGLAKSPKPPLDDAANWLLFLMLPLWLVASGGAGLLSKKLPPLNPPKLLLLLLLGTCCELRLPMPPPRLAKGSAAGGFGLVGFERLRPPKASEKPPCDGCCC